MAIQTQWSSTDERFVAVQGLLSYHSHYWQPITYLTLSTFLLFRSTSARVA